MGFREARQEVFANLLELGLLSETVTYLPKHGSARSVTASVKAGAEWLESEHGQYQVEFLELTCLKTYDGGISAPLVTDQILREGDRYPEPYGFTAIVRQLPGRWTLRFERRQRRIDGRTSGR